MVANSNSGLTKLPDDVSRIMLLGLVARKYNLLQETLAWWLDLHTQGKFHNIDSAAVEGGLGGHILLLWKEYDMSSNLDDFKSVVSAEMVSRQHLVWSAARLEWDKAIYFLAKL